MVRELTFIQIGRGREIVEPAVPKDGVCPDCQR